MKIDEHWKSAKKTFMNLNIYKRWSKYPDFVYRQKKIGKFILELLGGTDRGATILIWEPGTLDRDIPFFGLETSDDKKYKLFTQANFMYFMNAVDEYNSLEDKHDVMDLAYRAL